MVVTDHSLQIPTNKEAKPILNYSGSFTPHYLEKVGDVVDSIFADDFESGDLNLWTSSVTDSGDLSAERYASYWGDYGLSAEINDTNPIYVQDDAPASDAIYLARFYLDPSRLTVGTGSVVTLFSGLGGGSEIFRLQLQKTGTLYRVRIGIKNIGGSWTDGAWKNINTGWTALEMQWVAADDNGYMSLWVDGNASGSVSPVDNGTLLLDSVRLGVLSISGTGTVGTLYFDDFESRRRSNIGLLPEPGVEEPEPVAEPGWDAVQYTYDTQHPHAVTALSSGESYTYDANGNMTQRVENGITWTQTYNAENRLATLSDASTTWALSYDGDGSRVAQVVTNGTSIIQTRYFAAGAYEETNDGTATTTKKYYSIAGQNIAMDDGSGMKYILTDHLGSTVGVTDSVGELISQQRYLPFGEIRQDIGNITQTDFGYISSPSEASGTGQRNLPDTGLLDYKARMYDPLLKRFIQPDTIVPGAGNPQSWNRYTYVKNNPIKYNDPSGHNEDCGIGDSQDCRKNVKEEKTIDGRLKQYKGITIDKAYSNNEKEQLLELLEILSLAHGGINGLANDVGPIWFQKSSIVYAMNMPGSKQVKLSGALLSNSSWRDTSLHEVGHVYDFKDKPYKSDSFFKEVAPAGNCSSNYLGCVGPFSTKFRSTSILYRIVNLLFKPRFTGVYIPNKPPTDYSFTGSIEDFADSYRIYVLDKTGYQKGDLNTTRMEIFDGYFGK